MRAATPRDAGAMATVTGWPRSTTARIFCGKARGPRVPRTPFPTCAAPGSPTKAIGPTTTLPARQLCPRSPNTLVSHVRSYVRVSTEGVGEGAAVVGGDSTGDGLDGLPPFGPLDE